LTSACYFICLLFDLLVKSSALQVTLAASDSTGRLLGAEAGGGEQQM
jgi:hypothetical protein